MRKMIAADKKVVIVNGEKPAIRSSYILVKTMYTAISPGTELTMIESSAGKEISFGYSAMGVVEECGNNIKNVCEGDIVACYGAPYVNHAEYLLVPKNLYAKVPVGVEPKEAALCGIGAIAIHALRTAELQFGETVVVAGLGVLGQMIAKIANAAAYRVIAYDIEKNRSEMLAGKQNIQALSTLEELRKALEDNTGENGADAVMLCAGGKRSELTGQSLQWIRDKGKVVIVGDIEPDFPRGPMFAKEAQILISRAGGPGRYDKSYEAEAVDYPYGFVRWTEGRNIEEYIRLVTERRIDVSEFTREEVRLEEAPAEFEGLKNKQSTTLTKMVRFT